MQDTLKKIEAEFDGADFEPSFMAPAREVSMSAIKSFIFKTASEMYEKGREDMIGKHCEGCQDELADDCKGLVLDTPNGVPEELPYPCSPLSQHEVFDGVPKVREEEWEEEFRKQFDELKLKPPKGSMKNLERELIVDYFRKKLTQRTAEIITDYQTEYEQQHIVSALEVQKAEIISKIYGMILANEVDAVEASKIINKIRNI